jgi:apolipoprotein D and lipocalin family protein
MKKLASVLCCLSVCFAIAVLSPGQAACEDTLKISNCETGVLNVEIFSTVTETSSTLSELIDECAVGVEKRKDFRECVKQLTRDWEEDGLIDREKSQTIRSCSKTFKPVTTVKFVDVAQYLGLWYQIASFIIPAIGDLDGVTAEYSLNPDGTVKVINQGFVGGLDGTLAAIEGVARVVDAKTNAKLAVSFPDFGIPDESEYWIIELAEDYSYAVVTNSNRTSLFILNRTPTMEESLYQDIVFRLANDGFDPVKIVRTLQPEE